MSDHEYCTVHDQPLDWCQRGIEGVAPHSVVLPGIAVTPSVTSVHDAMIERDMHEHGFSGETL
jgi:hypothetical protein